MSILKDILVTGDELKRGYFQLKNRKSISRESSRGVFQFTALTSPSLPLETTTMINKALERNYTSFVVIMTSIDNVTDDNSIKDYLGKIHQNPNFNMITSESCTFSIFPSSMNDQRILMEDSSIGGEDFVNEYLKTRDDDSFVLMKYDELSEDCKEKANGLLNQLKDEGKKICKTKKCITVINESTKDWSQIFFVNDSQDRLYCLESSMKVFNEKTDVKGAINKIAKDNVSLLESYVPDLNMDILNRMYTPKNYNTVSKQLKLSEADIVNAIKPDEFSDPDNIYDSSNNGAVLKNVLTDNDVKKANELAPTLLHLKTYFRDNENGLHPVDYVIGIKVVTHKISSESMINNIVKARKTGKAFFNVMKLTSGEMDFFKDFVFALNRIKGDVKSKFKDDPWWSALRAKRKIARILSTFHLPQQLVPNATIVISIDEAHIIKTEHGIDLMNTTVIKDIMNKLFLLGFVIVDPSTEIAYFMFDGRNGYEEYSFAALERENTNGTREIKNIMQVLGRM